MIFQSRFMSAMVQPLARASSRPLSSRRNSVPAIEASPALSSRLRGTGWSSVRSLEEIEHRHVRNEMRPGRSAFDRGLVQCRRGANQGRERLFVYLVALTEVDGAPGVPFETRIEEARRILQRCSLRE